MEKGQAPEEPQTRRGLDLDTPLIVNSLRKRFGRTDALRGIDLAVPRGSLFGLVGLNGAGKTTTLECALGLQRPDGGEVVILGGSPRDLPRAAGRLGSALDTPALHPNLTVREELRHGAIFAGEEGRRPEEVEERLGLGTLRRVKTRRLSLGNRRRLSLALALLGRPELVVLDEPFSGLDAGGVEDVLALLGELRSEGNSTVVLSSHQLELVERVSSHLAVIHRGRVLRQGPLAEVLGPPRPALRIEVDSPPRAREALSRGLPRCASRVSRPSQVGPGEIVVEIDGASPAEVNALLVGAGVRVSSLAPSRPALGAVFRSLLEKEGLEEESFEEGGR